jgi:hypothetical protein
MYNVVDLKNPSQCPSSLLSLDFPVGCPLRGGRGEKIQKRFLVHQKGKKI